MKSLALIFAFALVAVLPLRAEAPKTPDEVMAYAFQKMEQYKSWSGSFGHLISDEGMPFPSEGTFECKPPLQMRAKSVSTIMGSSMNMLLVTGTDHSLWLQADGPGGTNIMHGNLQKLPFDDVKSAVPQAILIELMTPRKIWDRAKTIYNFQVSTNELLAGETMYTVYGTLKPETAKELLTPELTQEVVSVSGLCRILVGEKNGFIHIIERSIKYSTRGLQAFPMSAGEGIIFKEMKFDQDVTGDKFTYQPPKGAEITELPLKDLTEGAQPEDKK